MKKLTEKEFALKFPKLNLDGSEKLSSEKMEAHVDFDEGTSIEGMFHKYLKRHALNYIDSHEDLFDDPLAVEFLEDNELSSPYEEGETFVESDPIARMKKMKKVKEDMAKKEKEQREKEIQAEVEKRSALYTQKNSEKKEQE